MAEIVKLLDKLVFTNTGKHLNYLQEAILEGTIQGKTYSEIAEEVHSSTSHVTDTGAEFWKLISKLLKKNVTKSNFRTILEQSKFYINIVGDYAKVNHVNICPQNAPHSSPSTTPHTPQKSQDLSEAPDINNSINFNSQISTIKQWLTNSIRLITIFGLSGVGKTALALQLIKQIDTQFTHIIWRDLDHYSSLETLQKSLIQFFHNSITSSEQTSSDDKPLTTQLITYLKNHPTLIIIDNLQTIFTPQTLAGNYQENQQNYRPFWQKISETCHPSCLLLLSWEKPYDLVTLET